LPCVVSAVKSGAVSLRRRDMGFLQLDLVKSSYFI
jgi:hypothetical protein